jgi:hypothetical protein
MKVRSREMMITTRVPTKREIEHRRIDKCRKEDSTVLSEEQEVMGLAKLDANLMPQAAPCPSFC